MNPTLIAIAISGALGALGGYSFQATRIDALKKDHANEQLSQQLATLQTLERNQRAVSQAQSAASNRLVLLKRHADAARAESDSLRESIAVAMRAANTSHDACNAVAAAQGVVLTESSGFIQTLAGDADQCQSDLTLMRDAWPK